MKPEGITMLLIPLLVFGAVAIILVVLILRPGTAARSSSYAAEASMPMMWTDGNADASCDSSDIGDCGGGDASGDGGGGGSE